MTDPIRTPCFHSGEISMFKTAPQLPVVPISEADRWLMEHYGVSWASLQPPSITPSAKASSRKRPPLRYLRPRQRRTAGSPEPKPLDLRGSVDLVPAADISVGCSQYASIPARDLDQPYVLDGLRIETADGSTWIVDCYTGLRLVQF